MRIHCLHVGARDDAFDLVTDTQALQATMERLDAFGVPTADLERFAAVWLDLSAGVVQRLYLRRN